MNFKLSTKFSGKGHLITFLKKKKELSELDFNKKEEKYIQKKIEEKEKFVHINQYDKHIFLVLPLDEKTKEATAEKLRRIAYDIHTIVVGEKLETIGIKKDYLNDYQFTSFLEGFALSNYQFLKYSSKAEEKKFSLKEVLIDDKDFNIKEFETIVRNIFKVRTWVNEPVGYLNTERFAKEIHDLHKYSKIEVEILDQKQIETLKMNGLISVNSGSFDPPSFAILEYKPKKAKNKSPYVLVGKGIVYDTGGLNIKTGSYMATMKSDMGGGATVAGAIATIAENEVPIHVIALIPITDNRPGNKAITPDDVITYANGKTVEVLNTDAEGRLILADALCYASRYEPELVIDFATLTGAALRAVGSFGAVVMGNADDKYFEQLNKSAEKTGEKIIRFPFWDEYNEQLKSDIADIKNIGGANAGAITAGKFLEYFTDYPYIHIDIAPTAYLETKDSYKGKGGTATGVRMIYDFLKKQIKS